MRKCRILGQQRDPLAGIPSCIRDELIDPSPDFGVIRDGVVALFSPLSGAAAAWLEEHCPAGDDHFYFGELLVVESRFLPDLIAHALQDGLVMAHR